MGKALLDGYRQRVFLMTKLDGRAVKAASEQLEQSLKRLRTEVIDLVQIREVHSPVRARRHDRGATKGQTRRQDSLHRLHGPQRSGHSPAHVGFGSGDQLVMSATR
jgi:aryl-alcohol dehydrogenase-like predicted oxidoreductase